MYSDFFKGKKITVMGAGLLGGVADIRFLAEQGADLIVTDLKSEAELQPVVEGLKGFPNIRYTLGRHDMADFQGRDLVIKAPTTPLDSPYVAAAREAGIPITMWAALFSRFARAEGAKILGVTGTRGKTTVTEMIAHVLCQAEKKVITGGNLRGSATLSHLPEVTPEAIIVLELDSWKLQGFGEEHLSPDIAIFTNLLSDHMNYYGGDMQKYFADKAHIFEFQTEGDILIAGRAVADTWITPAHPPVPPRVPPALPADWELQVIGEHNRENAALATEALRAVGLTDEVIRAGLASFVPVGGRLQYLGEKGGVQIYNDNTATSPDATIAALTALVSLREKPVLMIGGADKQLPLERLASTIPGCVHAVVYLAGTGTDKLAPLLDPELQKRNIPFVTAHSMAEAVTSARGFLQGKGALLLSPAFASFGMFKNEYDRDTQFLEEIKKI